MAGFRTEEIKVEAQALVRDLVIEKTTYTGKELFELQNEQIPCLVDPIIPKVGLFALVGSSDTGKSMLYRQLAISVVQGASFLDFTLNIEHGKVLFIVTEDDPTSTAYLLRKQCTSIHGLDNLCCVFESENTIEQITERLESGERFDLIIIDAWSDVFGQNLNDSALIRQTLNRYRSIALKYQCAIGFLHHTGKRTQKIAPSKDNILSGQGFEAKMRLVLELRNDPMDGDYRHLCIVKGNYLSPEFKRSSYKLEFDPFSFRFSDTGERTPFEDLAEGAQEAHQQPKRASKPEDISVEMHKRMISEIFANSESMKPREFKERLAGIYQKHLNITLGRDARINYQEHLTELRLITSTGKSKTDPHAKIIPV